MTLPEDIGRVEAECVAVQGWLATSAVMLRSVVEQRFPLLAGRLDTDVDDAIDRCILNYSPVKGPLIDYVISSVLSVLKYGGRGHVDIDDHEPEQPPLVISPEHRLEILIDHLTPAEQVRARLMLHVPDPGTREAILGLSGSALRKSELKLRSKLLALAAEFELEFELTTA